VVDHEHAIRLAEPGEVALLQEVERLAAMLFEDCIDQLLLTSQMLERVTSTDELAEAQRGGRLWVALSAADEPVGFALVKEVGHLAHLDELGVIPEHARRGTGSRLLQAVIDWAMQAGYPAVTLSTFKNIPWNAPFYERRGFRIVSPERLSRDHVQIVEAERIRGLRTELRVMMKWQPA
jgi:GNAT superfamily N-acetyltransferase